VPLKDIALAIDILDTDLHEGRWGFGHRFELLLQVAQLLPVRLPPLLQYRLTKP